MRKKGTAFLLICLLVFLCSGICLAEETKADTDAETGTDASAPITSVFCEYNDGEKNRRSTRFYYSDEMLLQNANAESPDMAKASVALAMAAYNLDDVSNALGQMGYMYKSQINDQEEIWENWMYNSGSYDLITTAFDNDHVAYSVSCKNITGTNGETYRVYCVPVRGTPGSSEWISNFNLGDNGVYHEGFYTAAEQVYSGLTMVMDHDKMDAAHRIVWLTGHSRGAAVANIVAGRLTKEHQYVQPEHLFAYTFACPAVSKKADDTLSNIYNYNNPGDLIPELPLADWGYKRYGQTMMLDSYDKENFLNQFQRVTGAAYTGAAFSSDYLLALEDAVRSEEEYAKYKIVFWGAAWVFGAYKDTSLFDFLVAYGKDSGEKLADNVLEIAKNCDPQSLLEQLKSEETERNENKAKLMELSLIIEPMTEQEFASWCLENPDQVDEIERITSHNIVTRMDTIAAISSYLMEIEGYAKATKVLTDFFMLFKNHPLSSFEDGHRQSTYVLWINSMFYGHEGWYEWCRKNKEDEEDKEDIAPNQYGTTIGDSCFYNSSITLIRPQEGLRLIGSNAFSGCAELKGISIPDTVEEIGNRAFFNCTKLQSISIPDKVTEIGYAIFSGCLGLQSVFISDTVEKIWDSAFENCSGLTEMTIPVDVSYEKSTFSGCTNVAKIHYTPGRTGVMPDKYSTDLIESSLEYRNQSSLKTVELDEGITRLGDYAFCASTPPESTFGVLEDVVLPTTLQSLGSYAFYHQGNIKSMKIPEGIRIIPRNCFSGCTGLNSLFIPGTVERIDSQAFENCSTLTEVTLPIDVVYDVAREQATFIGCKNVTKIHYTPGRTGIMKDKDRKTETYSLEGRCVEALKTVELDEGITRLGDYAFYGEKYKDGLGERVCGVLEDVVLPTTLQSLGDYAFSSQINIKTLNIPAGLTELGIDCFSGVKGSFTGLEEGFPEGIREIPSGCFSWCTGLTGLYIPETVEKIGDGAFNGCTGLTSLHIPETITTIEDWAFSHCTGLTSLLIPETVETIKGSAFAYCSGLTEVTLPIDLTYDTRANDGTFMMCFNVSKIHYTAGKTGEMPYRNGYGLEQSTESLKTVVLDEGITSLADSAFASPGGKLEEITLPKSLKSIGAKAFEYQPNLKTINIPEGIREIPDGCFSGCSGLTGLILPETIERIGVGTFSGCSGLTELAIPGAVNEIGDEAFSGCSGLTGMTIPGAVKRIGDRAFKDCTGLVSLNISDTVEQLGTGAFENCSGLTEVTLPIDIVYDSSDDCETFSGCQNVNKIHYTPGRTGIMPDRQNNDSGGEMYFYNTLESIALSSLKTIELEEGIKRLGDYAFFGLRQKDYQEFYGLLEKVILPTTIQSLGDEAFEYQMNIKTVYIPAVLSELGSDPFGLSSDAVYYGMKDSILEAYAKKKHRPFFPLYYPQITPNSTSMSKGAALQFQAEICTGIDSYSQDARWSVTGEGLSKGTYISPEGLLTVAAGEPASELTVTAAYTGADGQEVRSSATVRLRNEEDEYFSIYFDANGGTIAEETREYAYGKVYGSFPEPEPAMEGYAFIGWYTEPEGGELVAYNDVNMVYGNQMLFAHWIPIVVVDPYPRLCGVYGTAVENMEITGGTVYYGDQIVNGFWEITDENRQDVPRVGSGDAYELTFIPYGEEIDSFVSRSSVIVSPRSMESDGISIELSQTDFQYDGTCHEPVPSVTDVCAELKETDYTIRYENNVDAGNYGGPSDDRETLPRVIITGQGNYCGEASLEFTILQADLSECTVALERDCFAGDGSAHEPGVTVKYGNLELSPERDYYLEYQNNVEPGNAFVTVNATEGGNYTGSLTAQFEIYDPEKEDDTKIRRYAFYQNPSLESVTIGDTVTQIGDYAFAQCANLRKIYFKGPAPQMEAHIFDQVTAEAYYPVGDASWTAQVKENYGGTVIWRAWDPVTGEVVRTDMANCQIGFEELTYPYTGESQCPRAYVRDGGRLLEENIDYQVSYRNNINVGRAVVLVTGLGNYMGELEETFAIVPAAPVLSFAAASVNKTYGNGAFTFGLEQKQTDGVVTYQSGNAKVAAVDAKTGKVTICGAGTAVITASAAAGKNYQAGQASYKLTVAKAANQITSANITKTTAAKAQTFGLGAKTKGGAKLTYKSDNKSVKVSSSGKVTIAKNFVGKAKITIKAAATANYKAASLSVTVTVNPKGTALTKLTAQKKQKVLVKWKKASGVSGCEIQYSTDKKFKKGVKKANVKAAKTSYTAANLSKKKTYYFRIRTYKKVGKATYYSTWSGVKKVKVTK